MKPKSAVFEVQHASNASVSIAWPLLIEGYNELTQEGICPAKVLLKAGDQALYIRAPDGDVVAALAYGIEGQPKTAFMRIVYVEPSSRRLGYFSALWSELYVRAANADCDYICTEIHAADTTAIGIIRQAGAEAQAVRLTRTISR